MAAHPKKEIPINLPEIPKTALSVMQVHLIHTAWNEAMVASLVSQTKEQLVKTGVQPANIFQGVVPGAFELPWSCKHLVSTAVTNPPHVIIAFGVLIKGETFHFEYISESVAHGLMQAQLETGVPILNAVLNCSTVEQADARCGPSSQLPLSLASTAVHMGALRLNAFPVTK